MVLSGSLLSGFGFLRAVSPGAASRRGDSRAAVDPAGLRRIAPPGAAPGRRTAVFRKPYCIEELGLPQSFPLAGSTTPISSKRLRQNRLGMVSPMAHMKARPRGLMV